MWILYELGIMLGFLLYLPKALARRRLPHPGWTMRLGRYPASVAQRLAGRRSIWLHAVSLGEALAAQPLARALLERSPQHPLVFSAITKSGFDAATKQVGERGVPIFFPLDLRAPVRRAFDLVQPKLLIVMESELWPMVIHAAHARGVPIVMVNGRISDRSFRRAQWVKSKLGWLWREVHLFLMQSQVDADRLLQLGAPPEKVRVTGNLKWDASLSSRPNPSQLGGLRARLGLSEASPLLVAGSTHRGEEAAVLNAFHTLRATHQDLRLVLAPRHLERLEEIEGLVRHVGFAPVRASGIAGGASWDVAVIDRFGELPGYYGIATLVFVGGSLIPHGGQNPLEPASFGKPIVFGPHMHNFAAIAHQLLAHHAARQLSGAGELTPLLQELLEHSDEARQMGLRAQQLMEQFQGATERTLTALQPFLDRPS